MPKTQPTYPLSSLADGAYFEIAGLESQFRKLEVRAVTDCATTVVGERLGDDEKFTRFESTMANSVRVRQTGSNPSFVPPQRLELPKSFT